MCQASDAIVFESFRPQKQQPPHRLWPFPLKLACIAAMLVAPGKSKKLEAS